MRCLVLLGVLFVVACNGPKQPATSLDPAIKLDDEARGTQKVANPEMGIVSVEFCGQTWPADTTKLECYDPSVVDLAPIAHLSALRDLSIPNTKVFDLVPLSSLSQLQLINLKGTPVTDLSPLTSLPALTVLWLPFSKVTDLTPLAKITSLVQLGLAGTDVTDLAPIASLKNLTLLDVSSTLVPEAQLDEIRRALPKAEITGDGIGSD